MEPVITAQVVKSLMDAVVIPMMNKFTEDIRHAYSTHLIPTEKHFQDYLNREYRRLGVMNTLAFKNQQLSLLDIYQPLTIMSGTTKNTMVRIDKIPYMLFSDLKRILITDTAGMGKSTLAKYIFLNIISDRLGIPIYIELRRLTKRNPILDEIHTMLIGINGQIDREVLIALLKKGKFYFILDGFDEIGLSDKNEVVEDLKRFITNLSEDNVFILTSRPEGILTAFGDFQAFQIKDLKEPEAYSLLERYDNKGETSQRLIAELKAERNKSVKEFLKNPLLVSLLFIVYDYKSTIPFKKHLFYSQIYDALFEGHDLSKGAQNIHVRISGLDRDDFEKILRYMGFQSFKKNQIQYTHDQLIKVISEACDFWQSLRVKPSDFLKDLTGAVPLFAKDGLEYKWAHKSLSEYFAAKFIFLDLKEKQSSTLTKLYNSESLPRYINLLDLYHDLDVMGFKKDIMLPLLKSYRIYLDGYDEDSMSFFLRELCFQRTIKTKFILMDLVSPEDFEIDNEKESDRIILKSGDAIKASIGIILADQSSMNSYGKRLLMEKLMEKNVEPLKCYQKKKLKYHWADTLKRDEWFTLDRLLEIANEDSEKLGEVCEIVTTAVMNSRVYIEYRDILRTIESIEAELAAQSFDFDL